MRNAHYTTRLLSGFFFLLFSMHGLHAAKIVEVTIDGGIGPARADYLIRVLEKNQDAELILVKIDTPGGLDKSTREIVQAFLASAVPIVSYVAPNGARAASAGTFLLYASTLAAMAPGTHLGAASPVNLGGDPGGGKKEDSLPSTMDKKVTNDAVAYIRSLAQLRQRNVEFAEKAVLDAATLTAPEALKAGVINLIAADTQDLLKQLDGMTVVQNQRSLQLSTTNAELVKVEPDWRMRFLLMITDPTVAYLLLLLGVYGIFFELMNPGFILPGVVGGVSILIALYALHLLPINYVALGLIFLGIAFIVAEAFTPSFGILGVGGTLAFIVGSVMLIDAAHEGYQIAWSAIAAMAVANVGLLMMVLMMLFRARKKLSLHGTSTLIGVEGRLLSDVDQTLHGQAMIRGEIWAIKSRKPLSIGQKIKVVAAEGLVLEVEEMY